MTIGLILTACRRSGFFDSVSVSGKAASSVRWRRLRLVISITVAKVVIRASVRFTRQRRTIEVHVLLLMMVVVVVMRLMLSVADDVDSAVVGLRLSVEHLTNNSVA